MKSMPVISRRHFALLSLAATASLHAAEADLAKKLANPVSDLISVPIQSNYDFGIGPGDGTVARTNIQPVIPFELNEHWNLIRSKKILHRSEIFPLCFY
jgi:hypothetical protein